VTIGTKVTGNVRDAGLETAMVSSGEPGKIEKRMVVEYGITLDGVWLPLDNGR